MPSSGLLAVARRGAPFLGHGLVAALSGPPQKKHGDFSHDPPRFLGWNLTGTYPLVMTNIAMENGPFIDDFPSIKAPLIGDFPPLNSLRW